ncbi:MAG: PhnD/SsuA/transferrin family substrate-binding protein [Clostridiales bacterium]|nr:PhnD/SsuA/transferrin family substrate-binding protein [Clostridiales bacterium]MDO4349187.1 PhnD/SsuA/transferrin family substrate-binding protein [Eubacteriales bacterium]MDY4007701.1 MqnA/MqnD/SBP family protein [Candidatus Limiplasma sp.]
MKRILSGLLMLAMLMALLLGGAAAEPAANVAALKGPTAMGMVKLMSEHEGDYNFTIAAAIDEITPKLVKGELDIAAVPANLASVLYNNTQGKVKVLAVNTLGVLYIVENGDTVKSVEDLRGRTIFASGKGATPEYALNYLLSANGIDPEKDVTLEYKSEHSECLAALLANEGSVAMLPQPFVTTAQLKQPEVKVVLDMNEEWAKLQEGSETPSALITGVLVGRTEFIDQNQQAVSDFLDAYAQSVAFANENAEETAALIGQYDIIPEAVAKAALPYCSITYIDGEDMQNRLSGYLQVLFDQNPASVGGALPDDAFYYKR